VVSSPIDPPDRPRLSPVRKYGPLAAIVVALAVIAAMASLAEPGATADGSTTMAPGSVSTPITYQQALERGEAEDVEWMASCDPTTGRIREPSVYAPPCLPAAPADNGGATSPGVTASTITVAVYVPSPNADFLNSFAAMLDDPEQVMATRDAYVTMFEELFETYGRDVEVVRYEGTGAGDDNTAAQADAVTVAETIRPFAVLGGPDRSSAFAEELARRGIVCIACSGVVPDEFFQDHDPHVWGLQPTAEQFLVSLGDFITGRMVGRRAAFAGDPELQDRERVFGVVHLEQSPPVFSQVSDRSAECGAARGYERALTETFLLDFGAMAQRATTIVAKMKAAGVTTIIYLGDPIMPIHLTRAASEQDYHPEWVVTGTALTDTTVFGRMYDPEQWAHAFGISSLGARTEREQGDPWRLHEWFHGRPPEAANTHAVIYAPLQVLFLGIHMAGPDLRPETFAQGLFNYPPSGGGVTTPQLSFGDHGYFTMDPGEGSDCTGAEPRIDHLGTDDVTEIWWDPAASGPDEQGNLGEGMWRYANGGRRYLPGEMTDEELATFDEDGSITIVEEVPAQERPPDYPPPR
jgi:hypothetical protein